MLFRSYIMSLFDKIKMNAKVMSNVAVNATQLAAKEMRFRSSEGLNNIKDTRLGQILKDGVAVVSSTVDTIANTSTVQGIKQDAAILGSKLNEHMTPLIDDLKNSTAQAKEHLLDVGQKIESSINSLGSKDYEKYNTQELFELYLHTKLRIEYQLKGIALESGLNLSLEESEDGISSIVSSKELRNTYNVSPKEKFVLQKEDSLKYDFTTRNLIIDTMSLLEEQNKMANILVVSRKQRVNINLDFI